MQRARRGKRDKTDALIAEKAIDATPAAIKATKSKEIESLQDLLEALPPSDTVVATVKTGKVLNKSDTYFSNFMTYIRGIIKSVCFFFAPHAKVDELYDKVLVSLSRSDESQRQLEIAKDNLEEMLRISKKENPEYYRIFRAYAMSTFDPSDFDPVRHPLCSSIGEFARKTAGKDYATILDNKHIEMTKHGKKKKKDATVENAVNFILRFCKTISWGTKRVQLSNGQVAVIPKLVRTQTQNRIWMEYNSSFFPEGVERLQKTSFKMIVRLITSSDEKLIRAVDYVSGYLVNDTVEGLQRIIDHYAGTS